MKTKKLIFAFTMIVIAALFCNCASVELFTFSDTKYKDIKKPNENIKVSYALPVINMTGKSIQSQTKGGVTITVEVVPFEVKRMIHKSEPVVTYREQSGYDNFEIKNSPVYNVNPENITFKVRIRNNEQVPLRLSEIGVAIITDGTQWSFPSGYMDEWNKGMVMTGFEKDYYVKGPQLAGLASSQVVYIFLNGVPVSYDEAGSITKKSNFEWYFDCKSTTITKDEQISYSYESKVIKSEQCAKCNGTGVDPQIYKCAGCNGTGYYVNSYDGKTYKHSTCSGTGKVRQKCPNCNNGVNYYPLSTEAPIDTQVNWYGWPVKVTTIPSNAKISVVNTKTGKYTFAGFSNLLIRPCLKSISGSDVNFTPIIIEYQGKEIKVMPIDEKGKNISKIEVDFSNRNPVVVKGKIME